MITKMIVYKDKLPGVYHKREYITIYKEYEDKPVEEISIVQRTEKTKGAFGRISKIKDEEYLLEDLETKSRYKKITPKRKHIEYFNKLQGKTHTKTSEYRYGKSYKPRKMNKVLSTPSKEKHNTKQNIFIELDAPYKKQKTKAQSRREL